MKFFRLVPYWIRDDLPVNGRHPHQLAPFFLISSRLKGAEAERVKLHEWIHVVLAMVLSLPFIVAFVAYMITARPNIPLLLITAVPFCINLLRFHWPNWLKVEWEALPKGAEVAKGGDLEAEAESLARSKSYAHGKSLQYCRRRIAFWASLFGWSEPKH